VCGVGSGIDQCSALSVSFLRLYSVYSLLKLRNDPEICNCIWQIECAFTKVSIEICRKLTFDCAERIN
jgi:hypothetical protein